MDEKDFHEEKIKISDKNSSENDPQSKDSQEEESVTIQGKSFIKISSKSQERIFNIIDSTAEEEGNFTWKPEEKEVENHLFSSTEKQMSVQEESLARTQRKEMQPRSSRSRSTRRTSKGKIKKYPRHYYIVFYGVPILIILSLAVLVVKRFQDLNTETPDKKEDSNEKQIWDHAKKLAQQGEENYNIALSDGQDREKFLKLFMEAEALYSEAIEKGEAVLYMQVKLEMSRKKINEKEAKEFVDKAFYYYRNMIKDWQSKREELAQTIKKLQEEKK